MFKSLSFSLSLSLYLSHIHTTHNGFTFDNSDAFLFSSSASFV